VARAVERPAADGEILNVGTDEEVSVVQLAEAMHRLSGLPGAPRLKFVPLASLPRNYEDVQRRVPDLSKMKRVLDYTAKISLEQGLTRLWAWYRGRGRQS
jgi:UDP-glucose 4-epimerase